MKHIQTFESFLNEAAKNDNVITFKKFKDIDHTRLVKWMQNEFGMKYNPGMKWLGGHLINGGDFELDVTGWDKTDLADLKNYLKAQRYISESLLNESGNEVTFSVDDDKLDQMLNSKFSRQLDYKDDGGDSFYVLPRKEFDRFIDLADSSGFDVDYENSEDSVINVQESIVNEAVKEVVLSNEILNFLEELGVVNGSDAQKVHKDLTAFLKEKL